MEDQLLRDGSDVAAVDGERLAGGNRAVGRGQGVAEVVGEVDPFDVGDRRRIEDDRAALEIDDVVGAGAAVDPVGLVEGVAQVEDVAAGSAFRRVGPAACRKKRSLPSPPSNVSSPAPPTKVSFAGAADDIELSVGLRAAAKEDEVAGAERAGVHGQRLARGDRGVGGGDVVSETVGEIDLFDVDDAGRPSVSVAA